MRKADEYRAHAAECLALARRTRDEQEKRQLLKMAETWEILAAHRERQRRKPN
jgi:hypothetical protein